MKKKCKVDVSYVLYIIDSCVHNHGSRRTWKKPWRIRKELSEQNEEVATIIPRFKKEPVRQNDYYEKNYWRPVKPSNVSY